MPLYEYSCDECEAVVEEFRSIANRDDPVVCPVCGGETRRGVGGGQFMLIGGGWSGNAHSIYVPPKSDPNARTKPHDNYSGCTPESVRRGCTQQYTNPERRR